MKIICKSFLNRHYKVALTFVNQYNYQIAVLNSEIIIN